jgi:hypothetical protein
MVQSSETTGISEDLLGLNRKSVQKMASLSALGAGAIALTSGNADASTIISQTGIDLRVGFDCGCTGHTPYQASTFINLNFGALAGYAAMAFHTASAPGSTFYKARLFVLGAAHEEHLVPNATGTGSHYAAGPFQFRLQPNSAPGSHIFNSFIGLFSAGANFSSGPAGSGIFPVAQRFITYNPSNATTRSTSLFPAGATTGYALFKFDDPACGGGSCYGWVQMQVAFQPNGPNVDILGWAYDTSGNPLPAGTGAVPEPSTMAMTGLAALVLGAKGVRQWRRARKS